MSEHEPAQPAGRRRLVGAAILLAACTALATIAIVAMEESVVYYLTPTEAVQEGQTDRDIRVGGLVVDGSMAEDAQRSTLSITDGDTDMTIAYAGRFPDMIREGEGAVVDGRWVNGVFVGEEVLMRHSNEYRAPEEASP
ncbi:cytochrome c maturation protein CcmE [Microbacterium sp. LRZ72]|uniref:cytochrome c maturation protein CcmE n=1 Tax=Microbacterium sp. LRZ72 TaxID=2942481 RepID=UPI0029A949AD|nr:cytochrome c maturation protein CcmE [Microbacterium sp. LRZ72]MDX2377256.1 cytochrome c maturation protein CcmE [Microbacterium sp. LRZ72]